MGRLRARWSLVAAVHMQVPRSNDQLWVRRMELYRHGVDAGLPDAFSGSQASATLEGQERWNPDASKWWMVLQVAERTVQTDETAIDKESALAALLDELTGDLRCGLPPHKYEEYTGGKAPAGKGWKGGKGLPCKGSSKSKSTGSKSGKGLTAKGSTSGWAGKASGGSSGSGQASAPGGSSGSGQASAPHVRPTRGSIKNELPWSKKEEPGARSRSPAARRTGVFGTASALDEEEPGARRTRS